MGQRQGTLLEKNAEKIFKLSGFKTKRNAFMKGYEVDVLARFGDLSIIIQCKQYEKSYINVKDLLHQWESKNKEIKSDKAVVVIFGQEATREEKKLAKNLGLILWDEIDVDHFEDLVTKKGVGAIDEILNELGLSYNSYENIENEYIGPCITSENIEKEIKKKAKIKKIKEKLTYSPILMLDLNCKVNRDDFSLIEDKRFNIDLSKKEISTLPDFNLKLFKIINQKPKKADYEEIKLKLSDIEIFSIKDLVKKLESKFYYSILKSKYCELEGVYTKTKEEIFKKVENVLSSEIGDDVEDVEIKYEPRIEDIDSEIGDLNLEISHLEEEKRDTKGFWGYKGDNTSEKRRSKNRFESLCRKQERKSMMVSQATSKKNLLKNRMDEQVERIRDKYHKQIDGSIREFEFNPEEEDCSVIDRKIVWMPKLKGEVITENNVKIPFLINHEKLIQIGECKKCKSKFTNLKDLNFCDICNELFCLKDSLKCKKCNKIVCKKDSWKCPLCDSHYCKNEKKIKCNYCKDSFCKDCIEKCELCGKYFCKSDLMKCSVCHKKICKEDSKKCRICGKRVCNNCFHKCEGCKKQACKKDFIKCTYCGKKVCEDCIRHKRRFLVTKQKRCVFCIDKK